jgi:hypothetical protein
MITFDLALHAKSGQKHITFKSIEDLREAGTLTSIRVEQPQEWTPAGSRHRIGE